MKQLLQILISLFYYLSTFLNNQHEQLNKNLYIYKEKSIHFLLLHHHKDKICMYHLLVYQLQMFHQILLKNSILFYL